MKKSKAGKLKLVKTEGGYITLPLYDESKGGMIEEFKDELVEVFRDGKILKKWKLSEIRGRCK